MRGLCHIRLFCMENEALIAHVRTHIACAGGWIDFATFMQLALYTPHLGYYQTQYPFGREGDFITAPELTPYFAQSVSQLFCAVLKTVKGDILELGAGSGRFAESCLLMLAEQHAIPQHYYIVEISHILRDKQVDYLRQRLPQTLFRRIHWLDKIPERINGIIWANEVLDALPVERWTHTENGWEALGVCYQQGQFMWQTKKLPTDSANLPLALQKNALGYTSEYCRLAETWVADCARALQQGMVLFADYGFPDHEYYHPQRRDGSLLCHYQHRVHDDPFCHLGLQDITAHVNFTQIAEIATRHGLTLAGFTNQAQFLLNTGILDLLAQMDAADILSYAPQSAAIQTLLSPAEMGELCKFISFTRHIDLPEPVNLPELGFQNGNRTFSL